MIKKIYTACLFLSFLLLISQSNAQEWSNQNPPLRYIVQQEDSLPGIAKTFKTTVEEIIQWNKLSSKNIKAGQELIVGKKPAKPVDGFVFWRVKTTREGGPIIEKAIKKSIEETEATGKKEMIKIDSLPQKAEKDIERAVVPGVHIKPVKAFIDQQDIFIEAEMLEDTSNKGIMVVKIFEGNDTVYDMRKKIYIQRVVVEKNLEQTPKRSNDLIIVDDAAQSALSISASPVIESKVEVEQNNLKDKEKKAPEIADTSTVVTQKITEAPLRSINYRPDTLTAPRLLFCGGVELGIPVGISRLFLKNIGKEYIYAFYEQPEPFDTRQLLVEFYGKDDKGQNFNKLLEEKIFEVKPKWAYTFFKCYFDPGEYLVLVYDANRKLMSKGSVEIREFE